MNDLRRHMMMQQGERIPGYRRVAWIQGLGGQFIELDWYLSKYGYTFGNGEYGIHIIVEQTAETRSTEAINGCFTGAPHYNRYDCPFAIASSNGIGLWCGSNVANKRWMPMGNKVIDLDFHAINAEFSYTQKTDTNVYTFNHLPMITTPINGLNHTFFCSNTIIRGYVNFSKIFRLYYARIFEQNFVMEIFPAVRTYDNKPGMYDIINDFFYTNKGTGEFIVGPNVN